MEPIYEFGLDATQWLQTTYPQLESFFHIVSTLGLEDAYLAILPLIYWSLSKRLGKHLAYVFLVANAFNLLLKHAFRAPRPYWLDSRVGLDVEPSYGIPSSHVQLATVTYLFLAAWLRRGWIWLLAFFMVIAMALSRVYLGVHFVHDVLAGFLLGLLVLIAYFLWRHFYAEDFSKRILGYRLMVAVTVPLVFVAVYVLVRLIIGQPDLTVPWAEFIPQAEIEGLEGMTTAVAALFGFGVGMTLEGSRVRFLADGPAWKRILRYLLGIAVTLAIWGGLRELFPGQPLWLAVPLRFLRYTLATLWISYYAPMAFVRLHLADAEPEPGIDLTL